MLPFFALANGQDDWTGTERDMTTSACINTGMSPGMVPFEVGSYWEGADREEDAEVSLDGVSWPDSFMVGDREIDIEGALEVDGGGEGYTFAFVADDGGDFGVYDMSAMCAFLVEQCRSLIADDENGNAPHCVWTLKQEENGGNFNCLIGYVYDGSQDDLKITDCSQVEDDDEDDYENGGDDDEENEDEERRRAADNFEYCDASYYRGTAVDQGFTGSCSSTGSCDSNAVMLDMTAEPAISTLDIGTEISFDLVGAGSGAGFDAIYTYYSIEACDTCTLGEGDNGYDRKFFMDVDTGASIVPTQTGYLCVIGYSEEDGLSCDTRQVVSMKGCTSQITLNVHFEEAVDPGAVLLVVQTILDNKGLSGSATILNESIKDLLPSLADEDDADDDDQDDQQQDRRRRIEGMSEVSFAMSQVDDVTAVKSALGLDEMNEELSNQGLPEAEWVYTETHEDDEGGLPSDSILLNDMYVTLFALAFLVAMVLLFNVSRMCGGNKDEEQDKKALMSDQQASNYGGNNA